MKTRKFLLGVMALVMVLAISFGCTNGDKEKVDSKNTGKRTAVEWKNEYPLQYDSYAQYKTKEGSNQLEGHYALALRLLAPVNISEEGDLEVSGLEYDHEAGKWVVQEGVYNKVSDRNQMKGCFACKTSKFDEVLEEQGQSIAPENVTEEFADKMGNHMWDCYICHTDNPEAGYDSNLQLFKETAGDKYDEITPEDRVCGQCHYAITYADLYESGDEWDTHLPFKYGFDVDAYLKFAKETNSGTVDEKTGVTTYDATHFGTLDEKTGITTFRTTHADLEITQSSKMNALGVSCVDCHMPEETDSDSDKVFTNHNASMSPLENEAALKSCLECHKEEKTTDGMKQMVINLQKETAVIGDALKDKLNTLYDEILEATESGNFDEDTLNKVREMYSDAKVIMEWGIHGNGAQYNKIVHNSTEIMNNLERSDKMLDEALALIK